MKYQEKDLLNRIEINPEIMVGKPVIKGTRIPLRALRLCVIFFLFTHAKPPRPQRFLGIEI